MASGFRSLFFLSLSLSLSPSLSLVWGFKVFSILFVTNLGIELQSLRIPALGKEA